MPSRMLKKNDESQVPSWESINSELKVLESFENVDWRVLALIEKLIKRVQHMENDGKKRDTSRSQ